MPDDAQLDMKMQEALLKSSQNLQVSMQRFSTILDGVVDKFKDVNTYEDQINVKITKTNSLLKDKIKQTLKDIGTDLKALATSPITKLFSAAYLYDSAKAMLENTKAMKNLSFRMGEAGKTAGQLYGSLSKVGHNLKLSNTQALEFIEGLRRMRVSTADMTAMATATGEFARITGVTNEQAIGLTGNLMRMGGLGTKATTSMLTTMANVQREVGLSEADMGALVESTTEYTRQLANMGKSAGQIQSFNKGVVNLAANFSKVGINIQDATQLLDKLLDPGQIEDNALLYAKLGISIQDAVQGNIDPDQLNRGLKQMGQQIKDMTGPAGAALAKSMGMTYKQALAYSQLDMSKPSDKAGDSLNKMFEEQLSPQEKLMGLWNDIGRKVQDLMSKAMPVLIKIVDFLTGGGMKFLVPVLIGAAILFFAFFRKKLLAVRTDFQNVIETATTNALHMAAEKTRTIAASRTGDPGAAMGRTARVAGTPGYATAMSKAGTFQTLSQTNLAGPIARMTANTAQWLEKVAEGGKAMSLIDIKIDQMNQKTKDRIGFIRQENLMMKTSLEIHRDNIMSQEKALLARKAELVNMDKTAEREWELKKIATDMIKLDKQREGVIADITRTTEHAQNMETRNLKTIQPEELKRMHIQLGNRQQVLKNEMSILNVRTSQINVEQDILNREKGVLTTERDRLRALDSVGKLQGAEYESYHKIQKRLADVDRETTGYKNEIETINHSLKTQNNELDDIHRNMTNIASAATRTGRNFADIDPNKTRSSFTSRVNEFVKGAGNAIKGGVLNGLSYMGKNMEALGKNLSQRLNPINMVKGIGGVFGSLGKLAGPLLMMATTLGLMEPIQKLIGAVLKAIKPVITSLVNNLFPILMSLIKAFLPLLQVLIKTLLPPALMILGFLVVVLGELVRTIGMLIRVLGGGNETLQFGDALMTAGAEIMGAATKISTSLDTNTGALKEANQTETGTPGRVATLGGGTQIMERPSYGGGSPADSTAESSAATAANTNEIAKKTDMQTGILAKMADGIKTMVDSQIANDVKLMNKIPAYIPPKNAQAYLDTLAAGAPKG